MASEVPSWSRLKEDITRLYQIESYSASQNSTPSNSWTSEFFEEDKIEHTLVTAIDEIDEIPEPSSRYKAATLVGKAPERISTPIQERLLREEMRELELDPAAYNPPHEEYTRRKLRNFRDNFGTFEKVAIKDMESGIIDIVDHMGLIDLITCWHESSEHMEIGVEKRENNPFVTGGIGVRNDEPIKNLPSYRREDNKGREREYDKRAPPEDISVLNPFSSASKKYRIAIVGQNPDYEFTDIDNHGDSTQEIHNCHDDWPTTELEDLQEESI